MRVIGLTGKACAGKDQYAKAFSQYGVVVINVDDLGHQALAQSIEQIETSFGSSVIQNGKIDRAALGSLVFSDSLKLKRLEEITHPKMVLACQELIEEARREGAQAVLLNAALLSRMGLQEVCDSVVFIYAPVWLRYLRSRKRDGLSLKQFVLRNTAQKDIRPSCAKTVVLRNLFWKALIHRQVATYCDTMGLSISSAG
ncbi:MAG: dephospho-CoA kinase [Spirochaetia bacterium]|nr:dephospho-CoA kinase [Spirochaetia bacterium]